MNLSADLKSAIKRRFPAVSRLRPFLSWQRHIWSDWRDNVLGERLVEAQTPLGFRFTARNHPANRMMQTGAFEPEETALLTALLAEADVFVDIGANIGYYTCLACQSNHHVVAVEPQQRNLSVLYTNLQANGWAHRAEVFPVGLGAETDLLTLYGASGPSASLIRGWAQYSARYQQTIPVTTLDILLGRRFEGRRIVVKIDVEGAEYGVIRGAATQLRLSPQPTWLLEICLTEYHPSGMNPDFEATFRAFWDAGYDAFTANDERRLVTPEDVRGWVAARQTASGTINYLFQPR